MRPPPAVRAASQTTLAGDFALVLSRQLPCPGVGRQRKIRLLPCETGGNPAAPVRFASRSSFGCFEVGRSRTRRESNNLSDVIFRRARRVHARGRRARSSLYPSPIPHPDPGAADALAGLDVLARSPTGSGKTLAFAVPIVERTDPDDARPSALVLVPDARARVQVTEELESLAGPQKLRVASVYGGVPLPAQAKRAKTAHVLVATPGRLEDLVQRRMVDLSQVRILILDEADRMLDMGFLPQVDKIVRRLPSNRQTMFFSATLDGEVGEIAHKYTNSPSLFEGRLPDERTPGEIEHRFVSVKADTKVETLVQHSEGDRRPVARLRPHEARRRPPRQQALAPGRRRGRHARRPLAAGAASGRSSASRPAR